MNTEVINNFIQYYITNFNNKMDQSIFINLWKEYSILIHNNTEYKGLSLLTFFESLNNHIIDINSINVSFNQNGDRRANILLSYILIDNMNNKINDSQFIQLAYSNNKEYWIHSSLMNN